MEQAQQAELDQQVAEVMQALEAAGEPASVESVARRVKRRTADVLESLKRLTFGTPGPDADADTPPEHYPGVQTAAAKVAQLTEAVAAAEVDVTAAEQAYAEAEAQAAEALIDGREPISLMEAQQAVLAAAESVHLLEVAQTVAKARHAEALATAQAQQQQAVWHHFQTLLAAHVTDLHRASASWEPLRRYCAVHGWRFGLTVFNGTMEILEESWIPHAEALLAQDEAGPDGGLPPGSHPRAY
jgi:hypothetical protein